MYYAHDNANQTYICITLDALKSENLTRIGRQNFINSNGLTLSEFNDIRLTVCDMFANEYHNRVINTYFHSVYIDKCMFADVYQVTVI